MFLTKNTLTQIFEGLFFKYSSVTWIIRFSRADQIRTIKLFELTMYNRVEYGLYTDRTRDRAKIRIKVGFEYRSSNYSSSIVFEIHCAG